MDFKSKTINNLISGKKIYSQSLTNQIKKDVENQKKRIERFNQLMVLGIQNKKYNLSIR